MDITKEFLTAELSKMEQQRDHAHDVAVASQAAIDVLTALVVRLEAPDPADTDLTFSDLGLEDPIPVSQA